MPDFIVTSPDGQRFKVTAPDGATEAQVLEYAKQQFEAMKSPPAQAAAPAPVEPPGLMSQINQRVNEFGTGVIQGAADTIGLPRTLAELGAKGANWVSGKLGGGTVGVQDVLRGLPFGQAWPTSEQVQRAAFSVAPKVEPTDPTGRAFSEVGRTFGAAPIPGMGVANIGSGLGSFGAREATRGTPLEPVAGLVGGLVGGVGAQAVKGLATRPPAPRIPTGDQLRETAKAAYKTASGAGVVVTQNAFADLLDDVAKTMTKEGFHKNLHARSAAAFDAMAEARGATPSIDDIDILRRVAREAAKSSDPADVRMAGIIIDKIDDFVEKLNPGQLLSGDAKVASAALTEARLSWSKMRKGEEIERLIHRAELAAPNFSASGMENALRTEFRNLAKNDKKMRTFSADEREAIEKIATGDTTTNIFRFIGRFAPRGPVSTGMVGLAANELGGVPAALGAMVAGEGARRIATARQLSGANRVTDLMRHGEPLPDRRVITDFEKLVLQSLLAGNAQRRPLGER